MDGTTKIEHKIWEKPSSENPKIVILLYCVHFTNDTSVSRTFLCYWGCCKLCMDFINFGADISVVSTVSEINYCF
jgi:hypothetical protein